MSAALRLFDGHSEKRMKKTTWLTEYGDIWLEVYGGFMNFGAAARYLKPLEDHHGRPKLIAHFRHYLNQTEARFVSISRFAETFGAWNPNEQKKKAGAKTDLQIADILRGLVPPLNWGPYRLQRRFAEVGFDGMTETEQEDLIVAYRKEQR